MTKNEFLAELRRALCGLSEEDIQGSADYYAELIDERVDAGMPEEDAVSALGAPKKIARDLLLDMPLPKIIKSTCKKQSKWHAWEIVLLVLGSPVWLPLLLSAVVVFVSVYVALWAVMASLWAADLGVGVAGIGCIIAGTVAAIGGAPFSLVLYIGAALVAAGLAVFGFVGCRILTVLFAKVSLLFLRWVKSLFVKKEK